MPKYKYPKETRYAGIAASDENTEKRLPRLHGMPLGPKQIEGLEIGDEVEVKFRGKVMGIRMHKDEDDPEDDMSVDLELVESEVYGQKEKKKSKAERYKELASDEE